MKPLLEVKALTKQYPLPRKGFRKESGAVQAVSGVDLAVMPGETLGIVGESGCGKSTLGLMIARLLEPTAGQVLFEGKDLLKVEGDELRKARRDLQFVFQDPYSSLNPRMKVSEIIAEPMQIHGLYKGVELTKEVSRLLQAVGLSQQQGDRYPHEFSGGQRQRIGIARALSLNPKLIICDEPISALDVSIQAQILNLLKDLQAEYKLTYMFISHGLPSIRFISDRIAVMYLGRIVEIATKQQIFSSVKHPYTEALLQAVPIPDPSLRKKERIILRGELPNPANPPKGCAFHTRCPYATERCQQEQPQLIEVEAGHYAACHYPLDKRKEEGH
ncbi:ABC transporter ATP-binding protein [Paenibacillus montaniterrae]|uniref:ABC transporter ATP-binding protein n=1 Tax=Paenibacillus montaniterrae TaxID=429341 RepID=A0A919YS87_9BACL|nr:oligopeptide/dipeptide ABC transporter ATP-binding protein [Paenibacillus montaniterrae]GIP15978.1 ABC transporter ATP-binding protein [Paenibacillus montaniterrae]